KPLSCFELFEARRAGGVGNPEISISTDNLNFGETLIGAVPSLQLTIDNPGTDQLVLDGLVSTNPVFVLDTEANLEIAPGETRVINVSFAPDAMGFVTETLVINNNAGPALEITLSGTGVAAPSLTIDPTNFVLELVEGQDSTLTVNLGNVGEADLEFLLESGGDVLGYAFSFTTDSWPSEFFWTLTDAQGNVVQSAEMGAYAANTSYTIPMVGLSPTENYTLNFFDSYGDGALSEFSVVDLGSGSVVVVGNFLPPTGLFTQSEFLGSPSESFFTISPNTGTVGVNNTQVVDISINSTGLATGTYDLLVSVMTNDPTQPLVDINITLYVIAPVNADFVANTTFVCGTEAIQFEDQSTNVPTAWQWDFGDGSTSEEENPTYTYSEDGIYTVTLIACNSLGCDTLMRPDYIAVETGCYTQNIPTEHNTETITVCEGQVFDSGGPNGDYLEGNNGVLIIAPPGAEQVSITFSSFEYEEHYDFLYVFDGLPNEGILLGMFTGNTLAGQTLVANSGTLSLVEFTDHFTNLSGFAATFTCEAIPVELVANFSFSSDSTCINEPVRFFDQSTGSPDTWFWDFDNGFVSNEQNPFFSFVISGTYNVSLTVCK
ncbi:MAG: PKD domain-containing protein, partial [Bacteroidota bacterium]